MTTRGAVILGFLLALFMFHGEDEAVGEPTLAAHSMLVLTVEADPDDPAQAAILCAAALDAADPDGPAMCLVVPPAGTGDPQTPGWQEFDAIPNAPNPVPAPEGIWS